MAALDGHTRQLELGDDAGWELDPRVLEFGVAHRRAGSLAQQLQQNRLLLLEGPRVDHARRA